MGSLWLDMIIVVVEGSSLEAILAPCMASMVELWYGCGLIQCMSILMILLIRFAMINKFMMDGEEFGDFCSWWC